MIFLCVFYDQSDRKIREPVKYYFADFLRWVDKSFSSQSYQITLWRQKVALRVKVASYQSVFKSSSDAKEQARAPGGLGDLDSVEWVDINISSTLISGETCFSEIFICI